MQQKIREIVQGEKDKFCVNLKALTGDKPCNPWPSKVGLLAMLDDDFPKYKKHHKICQVQVTILFLYYLYFFTVWSFILIKFVTEISSCFLHL